ncbi:MAG: DUF6503 family protein [Brumimicrobium sp.]
MLNKYVAFTILVFALYACTEESVKEQKVVKDIKLSAEQIIDSVYQTHGVSKLNDMNVSFDFRDYSYGFTHKEMGVERTRTIQDSTGRIIEDIWSGKSLVRSIDAENIEVDSVKQGLYKNSINSVFYFAFLPKGLKDPAVNTDLLEETTVWDENYYKIKVTFDEEGGGEDHEDVFIYWVHKKNFTMDYLAYEYFTEGGGIRFRAAVNPRKIKGVRFQDYHNFKPSDTITELTKIDQAYDLGNVELVSKIELKNIELSKRK